MNGAPKNAALFGGKKVRHCFYYFSPGAVAIAHGLIQHFRGVPSLAPSEEECTALLLVGHPDPLQMLSKSVDSKV